MADDSTEPLETGSSSTWSERYLPTIVLGVLVGGVLPAAYYVVGLRAAMLVTLMSLFLMAYVTKLSE
jgi:hypothetical protein